ncbi:MAG: ABC transporter ATP-binding protein [Bacteroidota bacterium]|nr:ABC transporter ATP-binding protein [Bacteroidota bacterium]MDP4215801.1 ABC transporter ATP-binding protein [Bacteroidota bacterium]MDP4245300.1 ABC transporter ATP-binding protein [Bacteroidota bacterium]MDP4256591.1 ABC transporter ATP-binding protein [Bacteroidota bacterium]
MDILQVNNLQKNFATQKAVDSVSFSLQKGSIFGLLGPNGAGKTTLIRMLTGIFYPDEGNVLFDGKPFDPVHDPVKIGYMPEERGLYKKMKIGEQAIYLAQLKGLTKHEATERVKRWFVKFEMETWWNKKVQDLSKGMGQKLQFVITVLHEPKLIILDEPFSGLDPVNSNLIKEEIYQLARNGSAVIFSTHRMEQVEEICDHIILMNKGQKILDGTVSGVKRQFSENLFSIGLEQVDGTVSSPAFEVVGRRDQGLVVKIHDGHRPNDVLDYFIRRQTGITSFMEILPSLNDIFIKLVEGTPLARQFQPVTA